MILDIKPEDLPMLTDALIDHKYFLEETHGKYMYEPVQEKINRINQIIDHLQKVQEQDTWVQ